MDTKFTRNTRLDTNWKRNYTNGYLIYTNTNDWIRIEYETARMVIKFTQAHTTVYKLNTKPHERLLNLHQHTRLDTNWIRNHRMDIKLTRTRTTGYELNMNCKNGTKLTQTHTTVCELNMNINGSKWTQTHRTEYELNKNPYEWIRNWHERTRMDTTWTQTHTSKY